MADRTTISLDRDAHAALHSVRGFMGQSISGALDVAVRDYVEKIEQRIAAARKTGVGGFRAAKAIKK